MNTEYVRNGSGNIIGVKLTTNDALGRPYFTTIAAAAEPNATQALIDATWPALNQAAANPAVAPGYIALPNSVFLAGA